jgi:hypothetical protein
MIAEDAIAVHIGGSARGYLLGFAWSGATVMFQHASGCPYVLFIGALGVNFRICRVEVGRARRQGGSPQGPRRRSSRSPAAARCVCASCPTRPRSVIGGPVAGARRAEVFGAPAGSAARSGPRCRDLAQWQGMNPYPTALIARTVRLRQWPRGRCGRGTKVMVGSAGGAGPARPRSSARPVRAGGAARGGPRRCGATPAGSARVAGPGAGADRAG